MKILRKIRLRLNELKRLLYTASNVKKFCGKGILSQIYEILILRFSKGKLRATEYFDYGLFNDNLYSLREKKYFVGSNMERTINYLLNYEQWHAIANDKLILYCILRGLGLPSPEIYAVYRSTPRFSGSVPCFTDVNSFADFLRNRIRYPFFSKPVVGAFGRGANAVKEYDKTLDKLILINGDEIGVDHYVASLSIPSGFEYLFQEYLTPHNAIRAICGYRLSTVRLNILLGNETPVLFYALWKIPTGQNITDNFSHGNTGNLLGQIDLNTGLIKRVIGGIGIEQTEVEVHPDTGKPLIGVTLPDWGKLVEVCLTVATAIPGLRLQHWDVAMCQDGPVILELNALGSFDLLQLTSRSGIYDENFRSYISQLTM